MTPSERAKKIRSCLTIIEEHAKILREENFYPILRSQGGNTIIINPSAPIRLDCQRKITTTETL